MTSNLARRGLALGFVTSSFLALIPASPALAEPVAPASQAHLRADVEKLVSFGTRHTLSSATDPRRGIGAARAWAAAEFARTGKACGNCLEVVQPEQTVTGTRIPAPTRIVDVVAIQKGTQRPDEVVIVQGHIDSRVSDVMDTTHDAPGANDDASGVALVLEAARVLSQHRYPVTIVYAALSGEEQGLYGGKVLADYAKARGWTVKGVLNNDIVGGSCGSDGYCDDAHVRVFSEGPRADEGDATRAAVRRFGGENDSPARNLSRYIAALAGENPADEGLAGKDFAVRQIWRADRMGRGGDQLPFLALGYPAVRFTVAVENYDEQHQDLRTEKGVVYGDTVDRMDFPYLAKVTDLNIATLDHLARSPMPPAPKADAAVKTWTDVSWQAVPGAVAYSVYKRATNAAEWEATPLVKATPQTAVKLDGFRGDDWLIGVSAIAADGSESPVAGAVPGGAFVPLVQR
ncbi:M20/M25/M40 family metallo-hydrolase [Novosphingobium sp. 1949]|uniref:M20/M25/M40 family metallo-hydrolase n=1 Tax=Novosphingobium organovorum TaxID=2930092 RepID=A0ABT0BA00_9SPHN|nr:M28 family peptidase [Novosphingobium organovorum]MCJ2181902.1 M20/M25/M40 family metallo-hydrolase [Novosphingobium organovorum]